MPFSDFGVQPELTIFAVVAQLGLTNWQIARLMLSQS